MTFNQDLMIEKALEALYRTLPEVPWNVELAYGLTMEWHPLRSHPFSHTESDSIRILKLHGSLNWLYLGEKGAALENMPGNRLGTLCGVDSQKIRTGIEAPRKGDEWFPLAVPPIYEKSSQIGEDLAPVWRDAEKELSEADEMIVFGYSFPDADVSAQVLFRASCHANRRLAGVSVINPDYGVDSKIAKLIGNRPIHHYPCVPSFLQDFRAGGGTGRQ